MQRWVLYIKYLLLLSLHPTSEPATELGKSPQSIFLPPTSAQCHEKLFWRKSTILILHNYRWYAKLCILGNFFQMWLSKYFIPSDKNLNFSRYQACAHPTNIHGHLTATLYTLQVSMCTCGNGTCGHTTLKMSYEPMLHCVPNCHSTRYTWIL